MNKTFESFFIFNDRIVFGYTIKNNNHHGGQL